MKLAGYCGAAAYPNRRFKDRKANLLIAGATRTVIGLLAGLGAIAALNSLDAEPTRVRK